MDDITPRNARFREIADRFPAHDRWLLEHGQPQFAYGRFLIVQRAPGWDEGHVYVFADTLREAQELAADDSGWWPVGVFDLDTPAEWEPVVRVQLLERA